MTHLSDENLADALFGAAEDRALAHLRECRECAERLAEAEAGLAAARRDVVPEPSPLYWQALRRNVGRRVSEEPRPHPVAWLVPIAAAAALAAVVAIGRLPVSGVEPAAGPSAATVLPSWSPLPPLEEDEAVPLLESVLLVAGASGWDEGKGVDAYVAGLTEDESSSLARALAARRSTNDQGEDL
jgi:hypothetical protein